jgi:putative ABC transport system permease protein
VDADLWVASKKPDIKGFGAELRGWWEIDTIIRNVEKIWSSIIGVIAFLLFVSAGISVLNIIFMVVAERTIEIGTLMAIGAKAADIRRLFTCEAAIIGVVGGIGGIFVGNLVVVVMGLIGVPFDSPFSSGFITVYPKVNVFETLVVFIGAIAICLVAAFFPARKAAKVEPVRAFKGQVV